MRNVVGCMTGTSIDGLDVSLVEIEGHGLSMRARVVRSLSRGLGELGPRLRAIAKQKPVTAGEIASVSREFALLHAGAIMELLGTDRADLVCVHGQTVFHAPPLSWQLMQPAPIAAAVGCPVVYDLRQADLAAGGQGAPITPLADWVLFRRYHDPMAIVNLGGFSNYTLWQTSLGSEEEFPQPWNDDSVDIRGGDICACNQLLDAIAGARLHKPFDEDGAVAFAGTSDLAAVASLARLLGQQGRSGRSLGTGDELDGWLAEVSDLSTPTVLRTACEAIATVITDRVWSEYPMAVAGGGAKNQGLMTALGASRGQVVPTTDSYGVSSQYREAICFAVLGALCQDKVPITIPAVTKVEKAPLSGAWVYP